MKPAEDQLTTEQAAEFLGLRPSTLSNWRSTGKQQVKYLKLGGRVYYRRSDLEAWKKSRERTQVEV